MSQRSRLKRAARKRKQFIRSHNRRQLRDLREHALFDFFDDDFQTALPKAKAILGTRPRDVDALQMLYRSALKLNDVLTLAQYADRLVDLDVEPELVLELNLGVALYSVGRYDEARLRLEEFLDHGLQVEDARRKAAAYLHTIEEMERRRDDRPRAGRPARAQPARHAARLSSSKSVSARPPVAAEVSSPKPIEPARSVGTSGRPDDAAPLHSPRVRLSFRSSETPAFLDAPSDPEGVRLRHGLEHARLARGFDELLCLNAARGVDHYWYQIETVKRALKRFHGRVLLADEVGLGKTVEAGMIATEYILRGLARRVLVLVPPSLVAQWRGELVAKFGLEFDDAAEHAREEGYWSRAERVVASVALARLPRHFPKVTSGEWDLVIVDEAHRLKNRTTRGWKLVNTLRPKFLLMLSATPVQNDLVELYNIVTLLRPGTFGTEAEFKRRFIGRGKAKGEAKDVEALREVLSSVMVRNTRSLIDAKLPRRFAETFVVDPSADERRGIELAAECARAVTTGGGRKTRMAGTQLLLQAGSSPGALSCALERLAGKAAYADALGGRVSGEAVGRLSRLGAGAKGVKLLELLRARPDEKKLVFVQFTRTLELIGELLAREGIPHAVFTGKLTPAGKERAVGRFRDEVPVLLSTGSGGEGRNLQFARTVVNFDLPWNPMQIEQRIGRVHRLGQERDVFVFNMALRGSIEERVLRILEGKINMFEMVVGEIDDILGDLGGEFGSVVFDLWLSRSTSEDLDRGFDEFAQKLIDSRERYRASKELGRRLFGEDLAS